MKNQYLETATALLRQTCPAIATTHRLEFKSVFGAVAGYVNGKIFISCGGFGVALRLPSAIRDDLFREKGAKHLRYFPRGHVKKEYAVLSKRIINDPERLRKLLYQSVEYALSF
jgi:TfoX-like protein